jgi:hypothetical protein
LPSAPRTDATTFIQAFKARDIPRAAFLVRGRISHTQEAILARFADETASG